MTDVIHHVPDLHAMFREFYRILKPTCKIRIVTESYQQIVSRFWVRYAPATVEAEKKRYPDIPVIIDAAFHCGLHHLKTGSTDKPYRHPVSAEFLKLVENKGYSMFHLISGEDFNAGLALLRADYDRRTVLHGIHGESFVWFEKA